LTKFYGLSIFFEKAEQHVVRGVGIVYSESILSHRIVKDNSYVRG